MTVNAASSATAGLSVTTIVSFAAVKGDLKQVKAECDARHIRIRYWENDERIRVSTGIFTQQTELNAFFDALERGLRE